MQLMGYSEWRKFDGAIDRAKISLEAIGMDVTSHFVASDKRSKGRTGSTMKADYDLSRFAAYMTAMNGDPRKAEVAAAQAYFAVMTRVAEVEGLAEKNRELEERNWELDMWLGTPERERARKMEKSEKASHVIQYQRDYLMDEVKRQDREMEKKDRELEEALVELEKYQEAIAGLRDL